MIIWTLLHIRLLSALHFVNISNMDKVVKWKRPACVEDSNSKNEAKNPKPKYIYDSQKYMVSSGDIINRPSRPFGNPEDCILHFYLTVEQFTIKTTVSTFQYS